MAAKSKPTKAVNRETLLRILDLARWAPSGDNTQPWRFEIVNDCVVRIHGFDTRDKVIYDFDGHASQIAHGALLETLRIAATGFGLKATWSVQSQGDDRRPVYDVVLKAEHGLAPDPLIPYIEDRTVQRRPMRTTPLTETQRRALTEAAGSDVTVQFFESLGARLGIAHLLWDSAKIRLTCPEAYEVHKEIIEWRARYSVDRIPEEAIGVDPVTARLMEWVLRSWKRVDFFNRFLFGTVAPRLQLDLLPGVLCAAHVLVRPSCAMTELTDRLRLGAAVQRVWLTATFHGLHLQPQMTPVIFRWYTRSGRTFSSAAGLPQQALKMCEKFERLTGATSDTPFGFFARIGRSSAPTSRSMRLDLDALQKKPPP